MFYTKLAIDHLLLYGIQNRLSPGSVQRLQHKIEKNNETFWLPPTSSLGVR
jgi:hypothetical protein